ncbi:hypothetical protein MKZ38_006514 [Zalerion maritima]|uniref:Uncharacterized protein n=1 Tax=Zalerion maritima TaxID=339359 RepID=A0AAD5S0A0_9PEZI|nr:hypothetical protein MKZ38_006514 [Zalerion maritima]
MEFRSIDDCGPYAMSVVGRNGVLEEVETWLHVAPAKTQLIPVRLSRLSAHLDHWLLLCPSEQISRRHSSPGLSVQTARQNDDPPTATAPLPLPLTWSGTSADCCYYSVRQPYERRQPQRPAIASHCAGNRNNSPPPSSLEPSTPCKSQGEKLRRPGNDPMALLPFVTPHEPG